MDPVIHFQMPAEDKGGMRKFYEDIKASIKKVEAAGGKISGKIEEIPGVGLFVSIIDTEGNRVSMMQPKG
jgi:predicted enzyme related to lactoylglutathione lyase